MCTLCLWTGISCIVYSCLPTQHRLWIHCSPDWDKVLAISEWDLIGLPCYSISNVLIFSKPCAALVCSKMNSLFLVILLLLLGNFIIDIFHGRRVTVLQHFQTHNQTYQPISTNQHLYLKAGWDTAPWISKTRLWAQERKQKIKSSILFALLLLNIICQIYLSSVITFSTNLRGSEWLLNGPFELLFLSSSSAMDWRPVYAFPVTHSG